MVQNLLPWFLPPFKNRVFKGSYRIMVRRIFGGKFHYHAHFSDFDPSVFSGKTGLSSKGGKKWSRYYHKSKLGSFFGITIGNDLFSFFEKS
jgi:hypothetical protein